MKRHISIILLLVSALGASAQTIPQAIWPIKDGKPGENIIGKPGQYINGEKNYDNLFIESPTGTLVVAPVDGIVIDYNYIYKKSLVNSFHFDAVKSFNASDDLNRRIDAANELKGRKMGLKGDISRYVSVSIGIQTGKNENYYISGLTPTRLFKTGDRIKKGDVIGKVSYAYSAFDKPHIKISRSTNSKSEDPVGVFGIKSTFVKSKQVPRTYEFYFSYKQPSDTLKKEFGIFRKSLEEIHPGLYDYTSKAQMDRLFDEAAAKLNSRMSSMEFVKLLQNIVVSIRDSHTSIFYLDALSFKAYPQVYLAYDGIDLVVLNSADSSKIKNGEKVIEYNGIKAGEFALKCRSYINLNEGFNTHGADRALMQFFPRYAYKYFVYTPGDYLNLTLKNGTKVTLPYMPVTSANRIITNFFKRMRWNADSENFKETMIKPDIAYLDINTFELNQIEEDSIENFINKIQKQGVRNLVVDVRDNGGGLMTVGSRILSYLIDTSKNVLSCRMVNSNSTYPMMKYSDSWAADQVIFPEFKAVMGKTGFYDYGNGDSTFVKVIKPNLRTHFNGNIYVLANEYSASMASEFPSVLLGQKNCKIIGRETGTCYYQMNAEKFANILMPATGLSLHIPMVKIVMRDTPNPRIPYGHGVIPDYNVPLTLDEFTEPKDVILDRALEIIEADGKVAKLH